MKRTDSTDAGAIAGEVATQLEGWTDAAAETATPAQYRALVTLWHTVEARHVQPGELVDLSHFDEAGRADFVARGFVEVVEA